MGRLELHTPMKLTFVVYLDPLRMDELERWREWGRWNSSSVTIWSMYHPSVGMTMEVTEVDLS